MTGGGGGGGAGSMGDGADDDMLTGPTAVTADARFQGYPLKPLAIDSPGIRLARVSKY